YRRPQQVASWQIDGGGVAPLAAHVLSQQDLIAAGLDGHVFKVVRSAADLIVIRVVLELEICQPDVAGWVGDSGRLILLLGVAGDALERWNTLGHRLAVEAGLGPAIRDLAQTNGEGAAGRPHFEGRIFRFARERDDNTVSGEGPVHRGSGCELEAL